MFSNNSHYDSITLNEYFKMFHSQEDLRNVFFSMDQALKYIHDHGYCIDVFYPTEIEILNNDINYIQFKKLLQLSNDPKLREKMINQDIFNSAFLQIGIYSNTLKYLKPSFLKENFNSFINYLPSQDIEYYRNVICNNNYSYLSVEGNDNIISGKSNAYVKKTNNVVGVSSISNSSINDQIYRQINGINDSAFINYLIIPTISLLILLLFALMFWLLSVICI